ncbi:MAG TPA: pitrilysin family protein [Candidatus Saccharibacteria bacterium]|jgi:predicted Zn-dependent peptidase|nr:pitrilysin family protein [Candidatus Saccharibacteria bacterium]HMT55634.1 pitrilysin family protein [Candidatus Saccharibacteria bacterium]
MAYSYEELPSGMTAVFGHEKHFQTSSAHLVFKAGSLHESDSAPPGVAHFLEHTPFQGTRSFPTLDRFNNFVKSDGSDYNAYTAPTTTGYTADGLRLDNILKTVFELGFHPLLTKKGLENDRNAVIEEARAEQFHPYRQEIEAYHTLFGGVKYARLITGNVEDIEQITRGDILSFFKSHYHPSNAHLVVCSSEPIREQRKIANMLASQIDTSRYHKPQIPERLQLHWLMQEDLVHAHHNQVDDDEAQSGISMGFHVDTPKTFEDYILTELATSMLDWRVFHRVREKSNLAYGATTSLTAIENLDNGMTDDNYYALEIHTTMIGENIQRGLDVIMAARDGVEKDVSSAEIALRIAERKLRGSIEASPKTATESINESAQVFYHDVYDPKAHQVILNSMSNEEIRKKALVLLSNLKLISLAGPNDKQLQAARIHASSLKN